MTDPIEHAAHDPAGAAALAGKADGAMLATLLRPAVVAAAAACLPLVGHGDADELDGAAVAAMRAALAGLPVDGRVVVGEGEKDDAPMLHLGERFGRGGAGDTLIDIAVDPVDGTRLGAAGRPGAMAVISVAPRGAFFDLGPAHYLEKLVTWVPDYTIARAAGGSVAELIHEVVAEAALARGAAPRDIRIAVQDRPRNRPYVEAVRDAGAQVELFEHGDIERSLQALPGAGGDLRPERPRLDAVVGVGGAPEGVIVAAAVRALGGSMLARFAPQSGPERDRVLEHLDGVRAIDALADLDELCATPAAIVLAAVTDCEIGLSLPGVRRMPAGVRAHWWSAPGGGYGWADRLDG
ncbi:fructose-bisphosphatase class II [Agromyces italicus]|uniref:fructose-bisphosphatase class II n=1 Tax=Agromyces italicus TaxID=279572 RepID=UPI00040057CD|nr:fructose-bisphosphatase class II [Agromyces italicus]